MALLDGVGPKRMRQSDGQCPERIEPEKVETPRL
jgi:hypothetical protein